MAAKRKEPGQERSAGMVAAVELVRLTKRQGLASAGPDGLPEQSAKTVLETALDEEMNGRLGRAKHEKTRDGGAVNARNGTISKTVTADAVGPVRIEVPRGRDASFEPVIVRKRRRLNDVGGGVVLCLYAKGLTTGGTGARLREIYGASVSRETAGRIADRVVEERDEWSSRPLDAVVAAVSLDAIVAEVRDGRACRPGVPGGRRRRSGRRPRRARRPGLARIGGREVRLSVLTDLKNRGVMDVCFLVRDGLKGLPDAVETVRPLAVVQTCVIHLTGDTCVSPCQVVQENHRN